MIEEEHGDHTIGFRSTHAKAPSAKEVLEPLLKAEVTSKPFSELFGVTLNHESANVVGLAMLSELVSRGYTLGSFDAVGALTAAAVPLVTSMVDAAAQMGYALDGFVMDFVYPSIKGQSIEGKRVILVDSWLSEKSYVQTSSLVTLRNGNELSLDFGIVSRAGAQVVAITSLIGGVGEGMNQTADADADSNFDSNPAQNVDADTRHIEVIDPVDGTRQSVPFVQVFDERELRAEAGAQDDESESRHA